jgi:hypothetical protein
MSDEPRFPSPDEPKTAQLPSPYRPAAPPSRAVGAVDRPKGIVVTRAEPLAAADQTVAPGAQLTREEMRALLAVEGTNRASALGTAWKRGRILAIPTGLISLAAHLLFGWAEPWASMVIILGAVAWTARPLLRRDDWS